MKPARNPWLISITVFFVLLIGAIVSFILFANRHREELVRPDYYAEEMRFQLQLDRLNRTQPIRDRIAISFDPGERAVRIALPVGTDLPSVVGEIHLYRPSNSRLDRKMRLTLDAHGIQRINAAGLRPGLWKVRVQWTVEGREYFLDETVVVS